MTFECDYCNIMTSYLKIQSIQYNNTSQSLCDFCGKITCGDHIFEVEEGDGINDLIAATLDDVCLDCYLVKFTNVKILK